VSLIACRVQQAYFSGSRILIEDRRKNFIDDEGDQCRNPPVGVTPVSAQGRLDALSQGNQQKVQFDD
jgi:hypothetical protein